MQSPSAPRPSRFGAGLVLDELLIAIDRNGPEMEAWGCDALYLSSDETIVSACHRGLDRLWRARWDRVRTLADIAHDARTPWATLDIGAVRTAVGEVVTLLKMLRAFRSTMATAFRHNRLMDYSAPDVGWQCLIRSARDDARKLSYVIKYRRRCEFPLAMSILDDRWKIPDFRPIDAIFGAPVSPTDPRSLYSYRFTCSYDAMDECESKCRHLMTTGPVGKLLSLVSAKKRMFDEAPEWNSLADLWRFGWDMLRQVAEVAVFDVDDPSGNPSLQVGLETGNYLLEFVKHYRAFVPLGIQLLDRYYTAAGLREVPGASAVRKIQMEETLDCLIRELEVASEIRQRGGEGLRERWYV